MLKEFRYSVDLTKDGDQVIARVVDVPEALTFGEDRTHALHEAEDALVIALAGYIDRHIPIPMPTKAGRRQAAIVLHPLIAAKVSLHNAMLEANESKVGMARKLGVSETIVRRLLDLGHRSHIGQIEQALDLLGVRLITSVVRAAG